MNDRLPGGLLLGYSTNVHRGETLEQVLRSLENYTVPIRDRVFGAGKPAGLELRIGIGAARALEVPKFYALFRDFLDDAKLRLFSVNAFPLGDFHSERVKTRVYRPTWAQPVRARWTVAIARVLADLMPDGIEGSISTLGGAYRAWGHTPRALDAIAEGYLDALEGLREIERDTGRTVVLAAEPEPDTTFETADDVIRFVDARLLPRARARWRKKMSSAKVEATLRRLFTVNYDTCHHSVVFRDQIEELSLLRRAGIRVGKMHVSSALALPEPIENPEGYECLRSLHEPRYLHQVRGVDAGGRVICNYADLNRIPRRAKTLASKPVAEIRSHFHVPVNEERWRLLRTTRDETRTAVLEALRTQATRQLVLETYTWPILAEESALIDGIVREFRWLLGVIGEAKEV